MTVKIRQITPEEAAALYKNEWDAAIKAAERDRAEAEELAEINAKLAEAADEDARAAAKYGT